jgi:hypothetical protein
MSIRHMLDYLSRDLRFSFRQLRKNPAFTVTAIMSIHLSEKRYSECPFNSPGF